jgi:hypothetical protein
MTAKLPAPTTKEKISPVEDALVLVRMIAENSVTGLGEDAATAQQAALQHAISQALLSGRLREATERAAEKSVASMEALRLAVCAFTVALRDEGITPEAVLISLKAAIRKETFLPLLAASTSSGPHLRDTITTWCIEDYFRAKDCASQADRDRRGESTSPRSQ